MKHKNPIKLATLAIVLFTAVSSITVFAAKTKSISNDTDQVELTCRNKAKELAAQTYRSCITETKSAQIEQVRDEYQKKLTSLKSEYDKRLKRIAGGKKDDSSTENEVKEAAETKKESKKPAVVNEDGSSVEDLQ